jgi:hypothetical protein
MAKRRRRRGKRKRPSLLLIAALIVLAAGFLTRRVLAPRTMHFLTHRSAPPLQHPVTGQSGGVVDGAGENLTDSDRRALDTVVRQGRAGR